MSFSGIDYVAIGQRLKAYRVASAIKADDIADNLGISRSALYRLEKGEIVKLETLEKLSLLLDTSLSGLLGVDIEYFSSGEGFFERMRQFEEQSTKIYSHFSPFSFLLTSPNYLSSLAIMLEEVEGDSRYDPDYKKKINTMLAILKERKNNLSQSPSTLYNLIGLQHIEHFLHLGLIGSLNLPPSKRMERVLLARKEVHYLLNLLEEKGDSLEVAVAEGVVPSTTFQIVYNAQGPLSLSISPFRLGELPNVTEGIASITTSADAIQRYQQLFDKLWDRSVKGYHAIDLIKKTINRF